LEEFYMSEIANQYEYGNKKFFAATLNPDGTFGTKEYHDGLMEVNVEFESESVNFSADDIPDFVSMNTPLTGEGTVKFAVLPISVYAKFFDVETDKNGVLIAKSRNRPRRVAFGFHTSKGDGSETMFTLYRAVFKPPALSSVSFDGQTIRDLTLDVKVYPYEYINADDKPDKITYSKINSKKNAEIWDDVQDDIYIPDCEIGGGS